MDVVKPVMIDVFAGIGGMSLAFERAGFEARGQIEIDEFCTRVLYKHWPHVPKWGDIRDVSGAEIEARLRLCYGTPTVGVMAGGFPCQDISTAGRGEGIKLGNRSGLWFEFARLIGELRPRVVLLENVPAITTRGGLIVLGSLAAIGYDAEWIPIPANLVGCSQPRKRWFAVAYTDSTGLEGANRAKLQAQFASQPNSWKVEPGMGRVFDGLSYRLDGMRWPAGPGRPQYDWEPPRTVTERIPNRAKRIKALGNAVMPQMVEPIARKIKGVFFDGYPND